MIAVIADDFTGAAELTGISLRYGLKVQLELQRINTTDTEVVIICTDSRSLKKEEAISVTSQAIEQIKTINPSLVYKKIDSVLRGYVMDELRTQMHLMDFSKAFLLPANPSLGRTVVDGEYYINEKKISDTAIANDPEFPIKSSLISAMLHDDSVKVLKHIDSLPKEGIVVGEAQSSTDIIAWANKIEQSWLLAGAGDFFQVLLEKKYRLQAKT